MTSETASKYHEYSTKWLKWRKKCLKEQIKNITAELQERKKTGYEPLVYCPKCGDWFYKNFIWRQCLNCGYKEIRKDNQ